jgi:hypothetical protein
MGRDHDLSVPNIPAIIAARGGSDAEIAVAEAMWSYFHTTHILHQKLLNAVVQARGYGRDYASYVEGERILFEGRERNLRRDMLTRGHAKVSEVGDGE